jgi:hypothetical protein
VAVDRRDRLEERRRLLDRHVEHLSNGLALVVNLESFPVIPGTSADLARHVDIGQEVHFDLDGAVTGTGLAATALDVEGEPSRLVTADLRLGGGGKELADPVEHAGVRRGVGSWGTPDR